MSRIGFVGCWDIVSHTFSFLCHRGFEQPFLGWNGAIVAIICLCQLFVSLWIDSRYDENLWKIAIWVSWYPVFYWTLNSFATVAATPAGLFRNMDQPVTWVSPDRGLRKWMKKITGSSLHGLSMSIADVNDGLYSWSGLFPLFWPCFCGWLCIKKSSISFWGGDCHGPWGCYRFCSSSAYLFSSSWEDGSFIIGIGFMEKIVARLLRNEYQWYANHTRRFSPGFCPISGRTLLVCASRWTICWD